MAPAVGAAPQPYLESPWPALNLTLSADGKFAAYEAREGDWFEIWLRDFPTPRGKWKVSNGRGSMPRWSPDGRYIYFWNTGPIRDTLMRAQVDRAPSVAVRAPERVAVFDIGSLTGDRDLHPDGSTSSSWRLRVSPRRLATRPPRARGTCCTSTCSPLSRRR